MYADGVMRFALKIGAGRPVLVVIKKNMGGTPMPRRAGMHELEYSNSTGRLHRTARSRDSTAREQTVQ